MFNRIYFKFFGDREYEPLLSPSNDKNLFHKLPTEIILLIASYLTLIDLLRLMQTEKATRAILKKFNKHDGIAKLADYRFQYLDLNRKKKKANEKADPGLIKSCCNSFDAPPHLCARGGIFATTGTAATVGLTYWIYSDPLIMGLASSVICVACCVGGVYGSNPCRKQDKPLEISEYQDLKSKRVEKELESIKKQEQELKKEVKALLMKK